MSNGKLLVVCLCAEWCETCRDYRQAAFEECRILYSNHRFEWIDIEVDSDLIGELEVENFPTLLIARDNQVLFFGAILPHVDHLKRLLRAMADAPPVATNSSARHLVEQLNRRDAA
jgi:hypothetical protein